MFLRSRTAQLALTLTGSVCLASYAGWTPDQKGVTYHGLGYPPYGQASRNRGNGQQLPSAGNGFCFRQPLNQPYPFGQFPVPSMRGVHPPVVPDARSPFAQVALPSQPPLVPGHAGENPMNGMIMRQAPLVLPRNRFTPHSG